MKARVIQHYVDRENGLPRGHGDIIELSEDRFAELKAKGKVVATEEKSLIPKDVKFPEDEVFETNKNVKDAFEMQKKVLEGEPHLHKKRGRKPKNQ